MAIVIAIVMVMMVMMLVIVTVTVTVTMNEKMLLVNRLQEPRYISALSPIIEPLHSVGPLRPWPSDIRPPCGTHVVSQDLSQVLFHLGLTPDPGSLSGITLT